MKQWIKVAVVVFLLVICGAVPLAPDGGNAQPYCPPSTSCAVQ